LTRAGALPLLQPVEDQLEPELELASAVGRALCHVQVAVLGEIRELGTQLFEQPRRPLLDALAPARREHLRRLRVALLPQREAEDVTVDRVVRGACELGGQTSLPQTAPQP